MPEYPHGGSRNAAQPVLPTGSIELQTHGSEVRFRNIYVREIPAAEAKELLATVEGGAK